MIQKCVALYKRPIKSSPDESLNTLLKLFLNDVIKNIVDYYNERSEFVYNNEQKAWYFNDIIFRGKLPSGWFQELCSNNEITYNSKYTVYQEEITLQKLKEEVNDFLKYSNIFTENECEKFLSLWAHHTHLFFTIQRIYNTDYCWLYYK